MSSMPQQTPTARIAQCNLSDQELAFIVALIDLAGDSDLPAPPGWTLQGINPMCLAFHAAADLRGIKDGSRAVTKIIDLRV